MRLLKERLKLYFEENKRRIRHGEIKIALGNESCDLDSFISSLVVGYAEGAIHVVNMKKEVFVCKGDLMWVCQKFGIEVNDLIFLERPLGRFTPQVRRVGSYFLSEDQAFPLEGKVVKLILTDHNDPVPELKHCEIEMIIDHHRLDNQINEASRIYIDVDVGSATTLVSRYLGPDLTRKHHCVTHNDESIRIPLLEDEVDPDKDRETLCASLAKLLLIPIVIDTGHLTRRTSAFDYIEFHRLLKVSTVKESEIKGIRKKLKLTRLNDHLQSTELILQKDFKIFNHKNYSFGSSTTKYDFEEWVEREAGTVTGFGEDKAGMVFFVELESFKENMGLDFYFVGWKKKTERHLIIVNFPYTNYLVKENGFVPLNYKGLTYYKIPLALSRKALMPMVRKLLDRVVINEDISNSTSPIVPIKKD